MLLSLAIFASFRYETFLTPVNLINIMRQNGMLALYQSFVPKSQNTEVLDNESKLRGLTSLISFLVLTEPYWNVLRLYPNAPEQPKKRAIASYINRSLTHN
ncbi:hypothetical protein IQ229_19085 [Nostoc cf. edaphicum LEGE 07299]|uniref:Transposase n=1 Tax=Nostoc cf. edaphicum LEGE 07299 TaxID=2777974 RepID=A0ABR9U2R0_9NOSO|nr:hypothetical protein [Nostoc edaphicum]MBE9106954.1 hypothetical protein [Nostoc cf. edaphicum LEGE 07299]